MSHLSDEQLSMLLDGELSLTGRHAATEHLGGCVGCAGRLDELVEVSAALRLAPAVRWSPEATGRVLARLERPVAHDRSTVAAMGLALLGLLLLSFELPVLGALVSMLNTVVAIFTAFVPIGAGVSGTTSVAVLIAVGVFGPALAVRLARVRESATHAPLGAGGRP
jgi:anti-sigma factor RsiW